MSLAHPSSSAATLRPRGRAIAPLATGIVLAVVLLGSVALTVTIGIADLSPAQVWGTVAAHVRGTDLPLPPIHDAVVWQLRIPRALTAVTVGAGLALCGAVLQALLRNPLADPYLLGVSSGASLGAVAVLVLGVALALPLAAFAGGAAALAVTLAIGSATGRLDPSRTVLAGVAVASGCSALTSLVIFWSSTGDSYREILTWLLGSLAGSSWPDAYLALIVLTVVGIPLAFSGAALDAFTFGETAAASLGVPVQRTRWLLLGATALLTSVLVSVSGAIGFVGLVLPHAIRLLVGASNRAILPLSALLGASVLLWADTAARTIADPRELPVGVVTALVGTPAFALILLRRSAR
ncbi:MAG: putative F420-0 ABC transporter permease subunit [Nostocoides sp.]